jgi:ankyrin repeat protein
VDLEVKWENKTPLKGAVIASSCDGDTIDLLLAHGAHIDLGSHTILHSAAIGATTVRGIHILFHLLETDCVRALVNTAARGVTPLFMAVFAGNAAAMHALL